MIETSVVHSIDDIPPADWERVCTGDPLWQRAPFSTYERAGFGADGMCYLVVREGRELLSIVPLFWFGRYPLDIGGGGALDRIAAAVRKLFPRFFAVRILFAGNPIGTGWPFVGGGAETGAAILSGIRGVARDLDIPLIILKDLDLALAGSRFAEGDEFFAVPSLPDTRLEIRWDTFDAYLASLPPAARRNLRSKLRKFAASGMRLEVLREFSGHAVQLEALYTNVLRRAKAKLDLVNARFFEEAAAWPGAQLIACFDGDRMIGFLLVAEHNGEAVSARVGLDYAAAAAGRVYFALQYEAVRMAIVAGVRTLSFCQTAYVFKREMGCTLVPLVYVATHRNAVARSIVRRVLPAVMTHYRRGCGLSTGDGGNILNKSDK